MTSTKKFELTLSKASEICRLHNLNKPLAIKRFSRGMINDVFSLDDKYVIKINTGHPALKKLKKEKEILNILKNNNIPVPACDIYDNSKKIIPYEFIVMNCVKGTVVTEIFDSLSTREKGKLLYFVGKTLAQIHSISFDKFGDSFVQKEFVGSSLYKEYLTNLITNLANNLQKTKLISPDEIGIIKEYFLENKLFDIKIEGSLLHGNFVYDNIIVDSGKIKGIIDWEWARSGHNEEELATVLYRVLKMNEEYAKSFTKGYEEIKKLDANSKKRLHAYALLYYLKVLPDVPTWTHRPDKQKEYIEETKKLLKKLNDAV